MMKSSPVNQSRKPTNGHSPQSSENIDYVLKKKNGTVESDDSESEKSTPLKKKENANNLNGNNSKHTNGVTTRYDDSDSDESYKGRQRRITRSVSPVATRVVAKVENAKNNNSSSQNPSDKANKDRRRFSESNTALESRRQSTRDSYSSRSPSASKTRTRRRRSSRSYSRSPSRRSRSQSTVRNAKAKYDSNKDRVKDKTHSANSNPTYYKHSSENNGQMAHAKINVQRFRTINNVKRIQQPKRYQKSNTASVTESAGRIVSAQKLKNNELQNRLNELRIENEKLVEEIRTLKRVHKREEVALKRFETQDTDIARLVRNHNEEANSLRDTIKKVKNDNKKLYNTLIEKDEEIRALKKKCDDMRKIISDKKLLDTVELTKQYEQAEKDIAAYKAKNEALEKKTEMIEKNHKHELGVEVAHHKETQKHLHRVNQENKELKTKLEEKERALDIANIYTRQARADKGDESMLKNPPTWKASSLSLNNAPEVTPRSKRNDKKSLKNKQTKDDSALQSTRTISNNDDVLLKEQREEFARKQQELEQEIRRLKDVENKRQREQDEKRQREEAEKRRENEAKLEQERLRKAKEDAKRDEEEDKLKRQRDEEKRRREEREKAELEEEERKKRYLTNNNSSAYDVKDTDKSKKDELLSKLLLIDANKNEKFNNTSTVTSNPSSNGKNSLNNNDDISFNFSSTASTNKANGLPPKPTSNNNNRISNEVVENLHDGKPTSVVRNDSKTDLLSKLFGNTGSNSGSNLGSNNNKLDKADDVFGLNGNKQFNSSKQQNSSQNNRTVSTPTNGQQQQKTSLNHQMNDNDPLDFFSKLNSNSNTNGLKKVSNGSVNNNGIFINRPKVDNKLLISPNKSNHFIEDIEELTL